MGKHDDFGHALHMPKKAKFVQPKPATNNKQSINQPAVPRPGHSAYNMFK
jgi:hypothetical protein